MKYTKEVESEDLAKALSLKSSQVAKIQNAIEKAYDQEWHKDGPNIDQINSIVAPCLSTPEEAFYAATVIVTDVFGRIMTSKIPGL